MKDVRYHIQIDADVVVSVPEDATVVPVSLIESELTAEASRFLSSRGFGINPKVRVGVYRYSSEE